MLEFYKLKSMFYSITNVRLHGYVSLFRDVANEDPGNR